MRGFHVIATLLLFFAGSVSAQEKDLSKEYNYKMPGANIPPFEVKTTDGKMISNKDFESYDKLMLVLFNPGCDHCQHLAKDIVAHYNAFKDVAIIYIGAKGVEEYIPAFIKETGLNTIMDKKNIYIGTDQTKKSDTPYEISEFLYNLYEYRLPQVNMYDKKRTMIHRSLGEVDINTIIDKVGTQTSN